MDVPLKGQEILDGVGNKTGKNKMVVIPGAPHFLNITNADAIRDPIDKFLSDVGLTKEEAGITDDYDPDAFNMQRALRLLGGISEHILSNLSFTRVQ